MISTIKQTKLKSVLIKISKFLVVTAFWVLTWEAASRILSHNNELMLLILPSPVTVLKKLFELSSQKEFLLAVGGTLYRVFLGFVLGIIGGFLLGIATHFSKILNTFVSPVLKMVRAVPVVAVIILMYLFFNRQIMPVIIIVMMVLPIIWQTTHDGLESPDKNLSEMAAVFRLSPAKKLIYISLPGLFPAVLSSSVNALGLAWKSGVAAEVICETGSSLGELLQSGKGNMSYDEVYAVTLTVIILSIIIEYVLKTALHLFLSGKLTGVEPILKEAVK